MTQYVTVRYGENKRSYTYKHNGKTVERGDSVIIDAMYSGVRPAEVVATSKYPPSKKPSPDGYRGGTDSTLR